MLSTVVFGFTVVLVFAPGPDFTIELAFTPKLDLATVLVLSVLFMCLLH